MKHDYSGRADLERVTDYVEEKELPSQQLTQAISDLLVDKKTEHLPKEAFKLRKEDIDLIVNEMEVSRIVAEKMLRKYDGNLKQTLKAMINSYCS
uniref:Nascent polypeptide-associated complex subunit alpha-like UBA domain-containing protein n=1 Tax=Romanomermis culicivorax TaxID=13658 RepID=A0A915I9Q0_ROMCU